MSRCVKYAKKVYTDRLGYDAICQICGENLGRPFDGAHKKRRLKLPPGHEFGQGEAVENMIAAHRMCHSWTSLFPGAEKFMEDSPISIATGGVIDWPPAWKPSLFVYKNKGYFSRRDALKLVDK